MSAGSWIFYLVNTCRQYATDGNKRPKYFELTGTPDTNDIKLESSVSFKIAVVGICLSLYIETSCFF